MRDYAYPNQCGVYEKDQCQVIIGSGDGWFVQIFIAQVGESDFRSSYSFRINYRGTNSGMGSLPSIGNKKCKDNDAAMFNAVSAILDQMHWYKNNHYSVPPGLKRWLSTLEQPSLFNLETQPLRPLSQKVTNVQ
jgi:hypothetical protein